MNVRAPAYFQYANAWRAAFFELLELENPTEPERRGYATRNGPYTKYEPPTEAEHEQAVNFPQPENQHK